MVIQWYGQSCFKITSGEFILAIDPFGRETGLTPPRFKADVLLVTHDHEEHSNIEAIQGEPFLIKGPGEYDVKDITVQGLQSFHDKRKGQDRGLNTIYVIEIEDVRVCHMGDFGEGELREDLREKLGEIDILLIPVGGVYTIDAEEASKIVSELEPKIVIPMHYRIEGLNYKIDQVEKFIQEMGEKKIEPEERLVIKKKSIEENKTQLL